MARLLDRVKWSFKPKNYDDFKNKIRACSRQSNRINESRDDKRIYGTIILHEYTKMSVGDVV